jgi:hypothetical protein
MRQIVSKFFWNPLCTLRRFLADLFPKSEISSKIRFQWLFVFSGRQKINQPRDVMAGRSYIWVSIFPDILLDVVKKICTDFNDMDVFADG